MIDSVLFLAWRKRYLINYGHVIDSIVQNGDFIALSFVHSFHILTAGIGPHEPITLRIVDSGHDVCSHIDDLPFTRI